MTTKPYRALSAIEQAELQQDLLAIHKIALCVAECPPITDDDHLTVKGVKVMAQEIALLQEERQQLKDALHLADIRINMLVNQLKAKENEFFDGHFS
jgi:uncharacterized small protein (DUF1192 family)